MASPETNSTILPADPDATPNATTLVGGIIDDATKLITQHVAMFRAEIKQDVTRTVDAAKIFGAGSMLASLGILFLSIGLVHGLQSFMPTWPIEACWAVVGGVYLVLGIAALAYAQSKFKSAVPNQSLAALQENVSWITKPRS